jgi:hypothetical protein
VDEILTKRVGESGGELGGEVGVEPLKVRGKRGKTQRVEEELRRVRTEHSAASTLLDRLHERQAVGVLDGVLDEEALEQLQPGMVVQLRAEIALHPLFQLHAVMASYLKNASKFGQEAEARELRKIWPLFQTMTGTDDPAGRILLDLNTGDDQAARIVAFVPRPSLQVSEDDLSGNFSALVQIEELLVDEADELVTLRLVRGAPPSKTERDALIEGAEGLVSSSSELGVDMSAGDLVMKSPLLVLRPVCMWR